jgi:hypothetical protein
MAGFARTLPAMIRFISIISRAEFFRRRLGGTPRTKAWLGWIVIGAVPFLQVGTLAPSDVRAITQHHEGFVWFGLQLGGLTRYDGYELKVCGNTPTIPPT